MTMADVRASIYLALLCGLLLATPIHGQAPRSAHQAFQMLRKSMDMQDAGSQPQIMDFVTRDGGDAHLGNMWEALAMDQNPLNVSEQCINSTEILLENLASGQSWALKVLDAMGKLESGLLEGNTQWLGSFTECQSIKVPYPHPHSNDTNHTQPTGNIFEGMPCTASMVPIGNASAAGAQGLKVLICTPAACSSEDINKIWGTFVYKLSEKYFGYAVCYRDEAPSYDTPAIAMICLLAILSVLIVVGTMYDILVIQGNLYMCRERSEDLVSVIDAVNEDLGEDADKDTGVNVRKLSPKAPLGLVSKLLLSFSVATNASKILATERSKASLDAVHGIRFISMTWVMLGHTYVFALGVIPNMYEFFLETIKTWHFQAVLGAGVSVDSFFLLSGTLVTYLLLNEMHKRGGPTKINWVMFYFHRFWRLTPPYMIILGVHAALFKYWATGPLWPQEGIEPGCSKYWWTNLLYINNLVKPEACMGWAWYLANDMQFFVISPLFIIAFYVHWVIGLTVTLAGLFGTTLTVALITVHYGYGSEFVSYLTNPNMGTWNDNIYMPPWSRIGPYLVGILYGYLIFKVKAQERRVKIPLVLVLLGWMVAAASALAVLYGLYGEANGHPLSTPVAAFYASMHRSVWAMALGWVVFACVTGYGGWVNRFLSWPPLIPLSRLTYMAYLVHPIVMFLYYDSLKRTIFSETLTWVYLFLGHVALSYGVAFIASVSLEAPMMGLEKALLKR